MAGEGQLEIRIQPGDAEGAGGGTVVRVAGEVDLATTPLLEDALSDALARSGPVTVDLAEVAFMDATGLGALAGAADQARHQGLAFRLRTPSHPVRRLLSATELVDALAIED